LRNATRTQHSSGGKNICHQYDIWNEHNAMFVIQFFRHEILGTVRYYKVWDFLYANDS